MFILCTISKILIHFRDNVIRSILAKFEYPTPCSSWHFLDTVMLFYENCTFEISPFAVYITFKTALLRMIISPFLASHHSILSFLTATLSAYVLLFPSLCVFRHFRVLNLQPELWMCTDLVQYLCSLIRLTKLMPLNSTSILQDKQHIKMFVTSDNVLSVTNSIMFNESTCFCFEYRPVDILK